jgi:hypothetical protein
VSTFTSDDFKRLADMMPRREPDPFAIDAFMRPCIGGLDVIESPDVPRYVLPEEVIPGVPWPPGFRDEINHWSREFLGTTNMLPPGMSYVIAGRYAVMRRSDVVKLINIC